MKLFKVNCNFSIIDDLKFSLGKSNFSTKTLHHETILTSSKFTHNKNPSYMSQVFSANTTISEVNLSLFISYSVPS